MVESWDRDDIGRDAADPARSISGVPARLPLREPHGLGEGVEAPLEAEWLDMALITRTTSLSQPEDSANKAKERDVALNTASYT